MFPAACLDILDILEDTAVYKELREVAIDVGEDRGTCLSEYEGVLVDCSRRCSTADVRHQPRFRWPESLAPSLQIRLLTLHHTPHTPMDKAIDVRLSCV